MISTTSQTDFGKTSPAAASMAPAVAARPRPVVGLVVIARNEGARLRDCLLSLAGQKGPLVYVDSGSTDGSVALARQLGAEVVELDLSRPFSMARARNTGWRRLQTLPAPPALVHFVDGDCRVVTGWVETARRYLEGREEVAAVCGRRRERFPEASLYNQLADLEWQGPTGAVAAVGGDALFRQSALAAVGGFDETLIAGEEPELCFRLRRAGWLIWRLPDEMTRHDAQLHRFRHWWLRMVRGGYGSLDVLRRCRRLGGDDPPFAAMVGSCRRWTIGWAGGGLGLWLLGIALLGRVGGWAALLATLALWLGQALRIAATYRRLGADRRLALFAAGLTMLGKWAQLQGQLRFALDQLLGRSAHLIEYKGRPAETGLAASPWRADRARYPAHALVREQSLWAVAVYRFGRWNDRRPPGPGRWLLDRLYWALYRIVETLTGVSFTKATEIGPGLRIHHFGGIFIHSQAKLGANCTLRQGVTIGNRFEGGPVPVIEDDVEFGAYAQVLGEIRIGTGAKIGAMSVVLTDVPPGHTAVGIPARIIPPPKEPGR